MALRGRGPQVVLEGYARNVARGVAGTTMRANIAAMDQLVIAGLVADGNTLDGSSRTGGQPYDVVVAQYPDETTTAWEIPAPLIDITAALIAAGGPFLPISGGVVSGVPGVTATSGFFGGIANPGMRAGGAALTWVGHSDNNYMQYYDLLSNSAFYPNPGQSIAVVAAIRSSDIPVGNAGIAFAGYAKSDNVTAGASPTWALYGSVRRLPNASTTFGMELSVGNLGNTANNNPYQILDPGIGSSIPLWITSGSEAFEAGEAVNPASTAIGIASNGSTFAKGIVFSATALYAGPGGTGTMQAMQFPARAELQWTFDATGARSSFIRSDATAASSMGILFNNVGFNIVDTAAETFRFGVTLSSVLMNVNTGGLFNFLINETSIGTIDHTGINYLAIGQTNPAAGAFTQVEVGSAAGPTIRAGNGAPAGVQPNGSLWLRMDGIASAHLYISDGSGGWVAVAGA